MTTLSEYSICSATTPAQAKGQPKLRPLAHPTDLAALSVVISNSLLEKQQDHQCVRSGWVAGVTFRSCVLSLGRFTLSVLGNIFMLPSFYMKRAIGQGMGLALFLLVFLSGARCESSKEVEKGCKWYLHLIDLTCRVSSSSYSSASHPKALEATTYLPIFIANLKQRTLPTTNSPHVPDTNKTQDRYQAEGHPGFRALLTSRRKSKVCACKNSIIDNDNDETKQNNTKLIRRFLPYLRHLHRHGKSATQ